MSSPYRYKLSRDEQDFLGVKSNHEWRKRKRRQIRAVEKAVKTYLNGSFYTPFSARDKPEEPLSLSKLVEHIKQKLSVKNWGR